MEFAIAKMSTKGQIVIPNNLRNDFQIGEKFLIMKDENKMILKKIKDLANDFKEDLIFAEKVEKAWQDYEKKKFKSRSKDDFLKELKTC
jgi:bifunctional DNA-binding transcriptional regulator/antitoxin component of YhaV-PrlF toxin-antitoxin module